MKINICTLHIQCCFQGLIILVKTLIYKGQRPVSSYIINFGFCFLDWDFFEYFKCTRSVMSRFSWPLSCIMLVTSIYAIKTIDNWITRIWNQIKRTYIYYNLSILCPWSLITGRFRHFIPYFFKLRFPNLQNISLFLNLKVIFLKSIHNTLSAQFF